MATATAIKQPCYQVKGNSAIFSVVLPQEAIEVLSAANINGLNFRQLSQLAIREYAERLKAEQGSLSAQESA